MNVRNQYLLWFANEHVDFRIPEVESIVQLFGLKPKWIDGPNTKPFWIVEFESDEEALKLASRSITLRSIIKLWGCGESLEDLHQRIRTYPRDLMDPFLKSDVSFQVKVESYGKNISMKEKVKKIELFDYLPANGPVNLSNPDVSLYYIEYYGMNQNNIPDVPYNFYFGIWVCDGQRAIIKKHSLKTRKFIGNTSMDPQLSLIIANQALVKPGDLVMDPFVGSGSLLVAAAHFGGHVLGVDIDYLMLHGKTRPTRKQDMLKSRAADESIYSNIKQYGNQSKYIDVIVGDSSLFFWREGLKLDSIITDPPYGIREATERIGTTKGYKIQADYLESHIPAKVDYCLTHIFSDLLKFAIKHLRPRGRLVSWIPVFKKEYNPSNLPHHPCLKLIANSEQDLTVHTSRRLLTWEKISDNKLNELPKVSEMFPLGFREHYYGHGETRKQKRERVAQELKEKGLRYIPRKGTEI